MNPTASTRNAGLELLSRINRWLVVGAVALTGFLSLLAERAFRGHTSASAASSSAASSAAASAGPAQQSSSSGSGLTPSQSAPSPAVSAPAPVVSGGS